MLEYLISFFKPSIQKTTSHIKTTLNYEAKIENLKATSIKGSTNTPNHKLNNQQIKFGKAWVQKRHFQSRIKRKHPHKTIEIEALKATNEYIGHYLNDDQTNIAIISKKIDSDYKILDTKDNTLQLDDNNQTTMHTTKSIKSQRFST